MTNIFDISGKVALVTGGYGHLGASMAKALAQYGAKVYVGGRSLEKFNEAFGNESAMTFIELNIAEISSFEKVYNEIKSKEGSIDILINNAYFGAANHPEKMNDEEWKKGLEGGLNATFYAIRAIIEFMKDKGGKIVNIGSMYGVEVPDLEVYTGREEFINPPNYGVAKAGVIHLTKYYAMALGKYNIQVNTISPGPFPSAEVQKDGEFIERLAKKTIAKRIGNPDDLAGTLLLLSSSAGDYITGQNIIVDGGWTT